MGRVLSWCADSEHSLRPIAIDCVALSLNIGARHRALSPDNNLDKDLNNSKKIIVGEDPKACYDGIKVSSLNFIVLCIISIMVYFYLDLSYSCV